MGFLTEHPHTVVSDTIDSLVKTRNDNDLEIRIYDLIDEIRSRYKEEYNENQAEAARKLRKLLKYSDKSEVKRNCFNILDCFITNGIKFEVIYNDSKLLLVLKQSATINKNYARFVYNWYSYIKENGLTDSYCYIGLQDLYNSVKKSASTSSRRTVFDVNKEIPKIKELIADALSVSIALNNALLRLKPGVYSIDDEQSTACFIKAREIRRKILKYLQIIQSGDLLGGLIHANDEIVTSLKKYDAQSGIDEYDKNKYDNSNDDYGFDDNEDGESSYYETDDESTFSRDNNNNNNNNDNVFNKQTNKSNYRSSGGSNPFGDDNMI
ncbi:hypothetical protein Kpol_2002p37 [Vanderwaltozyma polyspora DSM 70294]|uniref:LAS seventeen-binding protein 5 n=1 Tax=Vanderwaltozyma polyspora (strain ATCC 22028 / DSM 70294 / BCRC 21397 / CBS 2163 / NBRC 10782 / NRRL Y-8283 / UCD 57-17) TaxID=436907 RepID=A7TFF3_VANPO|nr:uncharacterized protein Kpol_2002p37 [Vanderwaltozyma polyspora DSM 70294]EDO18967.1 hypothetical protein Kpol_2002p37 [Vanderwaltozyma polyspora DSM 70294]